MNHEELVEAVARAIAEECGSDRYATAAAQAAISTAEPLIRADERKRVEGEIVALQAYADELAQWATELQDDLLMRGRLEADGTIIVNASQGRWAKFSEALRAYGDYRKGEA